MMVVMVVRSMLIVIIIMVMLLVIIMVMLLIVVVVMRVLGALFLLGGGLTVYFAHPPGREHSAAEVKSMGVKQFVNIHLGIVGLDDASCGLNGLQHGFDMGKVIGRHL